MAYGGSSGGGSSGGAPASPTGQTGNQSNTTQYQSSAAEVAIQNATSAIKKISDAKKNKLAFVDPIINFIHETTSRVVENQTAKKSQFFYNGGKPVPRGTPYHIHYTVDLGEYFMLGNKHNSLTKLIYPTSSDVSTFTFYNSINEQSPLKLNSKVTIPTEDDYKKRSYKRYFAKQVNDTSQPCFEVGKEDDGESPLYRYIQIKWNISGNKDIVYSENLKELNRASRGMPGLERILSPFQFYRYEEDLGSAEDRRNALLAMLELMKANFANFLANYSTTSQNQSGTNTGAGSPGTCSLGSQYTSKAACEAAGGTWTDGIPGIDVDADGNYLGNDGNQTDTDKDGNTIEAPEQC